MGEATTMFADEDLKDILWVTKGSNYIEVKCGCTVTKYGDTEGELRIFSDGKIEIDCKCLFNCEKEKISPADFGKHVGKNMSGTNWKSQIWVTNSKGCKVNLSKTCLLRYYNDTFHRPQRGLTVHRDEFIHCSRCNKERRFGLRSDSACRIYHDALANRNWKCSDMPNDQLKCEDAEERKSRRACRGCPKSITCKGCTRCVCFGCNMCRFADCNCRSCVDFIQNATS